MKELNIAGHKISNYSKPFIIAEAGINHNGEIEKAIEMIKVAKLSGANAIKFQTFCAENFIADSELTFTYKSQGKEITESMLEMFKRYEFLESEWFKIKEECNKEDILFLSSPGGKSDLDLLLRIGIDAIKVGSDDFTSIPLLKEYTSSGLPLILSCGMSDWDEISDTLNAVNPSQTYPIVLLLCTSEYPTPPNDVNLLKFKTLQKKLDIPLGFSDHTQGSLASSLAVSFGACVFEKHFTLDHDLPGPDHWFSEDPEGLKNWINSIKESYSMMGSSEVIPTLAEQDMKKLARKSIVVITSILKGEQITSSNIGLKRPGDGLPPKMFDEVIGKTALYDLKKDHVIEIGDFE
jgi:N,N'-diacetyllegionaminate synthase